MRRYWWKFFLVVFPLTVLWGISNPMFASPDEPAHMVRAQGIVRGQLEGPYKVDGIPVNDIECLAFKPEASADCMSLDWAEAPTYEDSTATNYPPLFHFLAGLPSLIFQGLSGAYVMRIWMAFICSSLLASAGAILFDRYKSNFVLLGWSLSITPMVLFVSSTVNPSGLAVALGSLIWALSIVWVDSSKDIRKPWMLRLLGISMLAFLLIRRDSLIWLLSISASILLFMNTITASDLRSRLGKFRWFFPFVFSGLVALAIVNWVAPSWSFLSAGNSGRNRFAAIPNDTFTYIKQAVGWFGWLDTPLSDPLMFLALFILGVFLLGGLIVSKKTDTRAIISVIGTVFLIPLVFAEFRYPYFQGRYYLPLLVGGFYLSGKSLGSTPIPDRVKIRFVALLGFAWGIVHCLSFVTNIRRY